MELIAEPSIELRPAYATLGIRTVTPFRGMLAVRDQLWTELRAWLGRRNVTAFGRPFLRLNVIDMAGMMDIEAGVLMAADVAGDERVRPGQLPAGNYATLSYRDHALRANKLLIGWAHEHRHVFDSHPTEAGDVFACRYELVLSDPLLERRKTQWINQLNFLIRPSAG